MRPTLRRQICLPLAITLVLAAAHLSGQAAADAASQRQTALALEQQGKNAEAEAAWRLYLKAHPSNPEPYAHLGVLEVRQGHYTDAIRLYRTALELGPPLPSVRLNLGLALFKSGDFTGAIAEFVPLLKRQPDNLQLTTLIGMAHYQQAEYARGGALSAEGCRTRYAESALAANPGAQLPVVRAVPMRCEYKQGDFVDECGVRGGRYAGR